MQRWTKLNISGAKPCARSLHTTCCIAGPLTGPQSPLLMTFGGYGEKTLNDMWLLDFNKGVWSEVSMLKFVVLTAMVRAMCAKCDLPLTPMGMVLKLYDKLSLLPFVLFVSLILVGNSAFSRCSTKKSLCCYVWLWTRLEGFGLVWRLQQHRHCSCRDHTTTDR